MTTLMINATEFETAHEAIAWADAEDRKAIRVQGMNLVVEENEALRLASAGVEFAYLHDAVLADGKTHRIVTVPVN